MEKKYFISKRVLASVERNADGTLKLTDISNRNNPQPLINAGALIMSFGSITNFWERCVGEDKYKEYCDNRAFLASPEYKAQRAAQREAAARQAARQAAQRAEAAKEAYESLKNAHNGVIPSTVENIAIVLRYLNTQNWGVWELPTMTIGYSCNQYDCDGKQASTMILDKPIDDGYDGTSNKFVVGAPRGHLNKYTRI